MFLLVLFVAAISLLYFVATKSSKNGRKSRCLGPRPPGPKGLPLLGNLHQFDPTKTHLYFFKLSDIYGPLVYLKLGFVPTIVVSSPKLAKEVLKTQDHVFCSRPNFVSQQKLSYNGFDLAFAPYNEYWREIRKIGVIHLFSSKRVQSFSSIREEEICRMTRIISCLSSESKLVDLSELLMSLSSSIICRIGFGKSNEKSNEFSTSRFQGLLHETQAMLTAFFFADYLPCMSWIDKINGASSKLERVFRELDEFYQEIINMHLDSYKQKSEQKQDIIDVLLQLREEHKMPFDLTLDHIKGVLMNIFVAGTDTTAATVVWAMTELMKNPHVMKKVQEEVRSLIKEQECSATSIQEEQLQHLTYLKAVVKETFRLHPASPILVPRQSMQKCTLGGYQIDQGTLVFVNAWAIGRDPESWDNPETFLPERFLGSPIDYRGQDFELIPFGAGRRGCPGMLLGVATIELALANLLCFFDWELPASMKREDIDMDTLPGVTSHKKKALCLSARNFISLQHR